MSIFNFSRFIRINKTENSINEAKKDLNAPKIRPRITFERYSPDISNILLTMLNIYCSSLSSSTPPTYLFHNEVYTPC